jgi:ornithine cyclodeaminase/alanine dehydrogenase-like protein (mu-crystallin family)
MRILSGIQTAALLDLDGYIEAVEEAFRLHGVGEALSPSRVHVPSGAGAFHVVVGGLRYADGPLFAVKVNARFPTADGRPGVRGLITLASAADGRPLAILDSGAVTRTRTAAAVAVAVRYLARSDSERLLVIGSGNQAPGIVEAVCRSRPIREVQLWSRDADRSRSLAARLVASGRRVEAVADLGPAAREADVIVTATSSTSPLLGPRDVERGTFIAAIGADAPDKQELEPELVASSALICDVVEQCARAGELHHAIEAGLMVETDVRATLGEVVAGLRPGRTSPDEVVVFDSTGTAMQDVAAAGLVLANAIRQGIGTEIDLEA